jgi:hypothetical protein
VGRTYALTYALRHCTFLVTVTLFGRKRGTPRSRLRLGGKCLASIVQDEPQFGFALRSTHSCLLRVHSLNRSALRVSRWIAPLANCIAAPPRCPQSNPKSSSYVVAPQALAQGLLGLCRAFSRPCAKDGVRQLWRRLQPTCASNSCCSSWTVALGYAAPRNPKPGQAKRW